MRKTLLLVFIHGFKVRPLAARDSCDEPFARSHLSLLDLVLTIIIQGGDDTFATFPEHLRALVSHALPKIDVIALTYPRFETRGDLKDCVARFKEW